MSLQQSPGIVTSGLTFYYDMNNTQKSFKGAPTTNYVPDAASMSGWGNYSNTANGTPAQFMTEFGTIGYRMDNVGSWNGVARGISLPSTGTYTFSAWIKWVGGSSNVTGGAVYVSGWGGGDSATATNRTLPGQWQRISLTLNCTTTSMTFYLICWGGTNNADHSSWQVTMPQVEAGSYATPFVSGTRTTSQSLTDLTNNYTLTSNNVTYNSNNTFSFSNSYFDLNSTNIITGNNPFTVDAWYYTNGTTADEIFGNYGTGSTSGNLWISGRYGTYINGAVYFPGAPIAAGTYYLSTTRDVAGNVILYKNGIQVTSGVLSASIPVTYNFRIGADVNGAAEPFTGSIYSVKVYNRVLSAAEVQQNFNAQRTRYGL
jgi:hypothetical protein